MCRGSPPLGGSRLRRRSRRERRSGSGEAWTALRQGSWTCDGFYHFARMSGAIALAGAARAIAPDAFSVTAIGIPIGLAIGLATALMPVVAKERFPERAGLSTGVYVTGISIGSTVAFALAVPPGGRAGRLAHAAADTRWSGGRSERALVGSS